MNLPVPFSIANAPRMPQERLGGISVAAGASDAPPLYSSKRQWVVANGVTRNRVS